MTQRRYTYDEIHARYERGMLSEKPERCPHCGNGAVEYITENDDTCGAQCSWCLKHWPVVCDEDVED